MLFFIFISRENIAFRSFFFFSLLCVFTKGRTFSTLFTSNECHLLLCRHRSQATCIRKIFPPTGCVLVPYIVDKNLYYFFDLIEARSLKALRGTRISHKRKRRWQNVDYRRKPVCVVSQSPNRTESVPTHCVYHNALLRLFNFIKIRVLLGLIYVLCNLKTTGRCCSVREWRRWNNINRYLLYLII